MAASAARVVSELGTRNRDLECTGDASHMVVDLRRTFSGTNRTRTIGSLELADVRLSSGRVIKDREWEAPRLGDRYFLISQTKAPAILRRLGNGHGLVE